ncbi:MAG: hypothetical protein ACEY3H_05220 [Wolbachia sp.]
MSKEDNNSNVISTGMELTNSGKKNMQTAEKGQDNVPLLTANSSESVQIIEDNISNDLKEKRSKHLYNNGEATTASGSKQSRKYLDDEEFRKKVKATLSNYVGKNCTLEEVLIRIRDNEKKGYATRVIIKGYQEIKVSKFLTESFCKDNKISRFVLMTDDKKNGLSCDVNERGVRCYKVQNGPPVVMTINWYVGEKKCTLEIELGTESHLKIIRHSEELTAENLAANKEVRINGKSLVEALQGLSKPIGVGKETIKQISSVSLDGIKQGTGSFVERIQKEREKSEIRSGV